MLNVHNVYEIIEPIFFLSKGILSELEMLVTVTTAPKWLNCGKDL